MLASLILRTPFCGAKIPRSSNLTNGLLLLLVGMGLPGEVEMVVLLTMLTRLPRLIGLLRGVTGEVGPGEDTLIQ